jgi:hypothetical protein
MEIDFSSSSSLLFEILFFFFGESLKCMRHFDVMHQSEHLQKGRDQRYNLRKKEKKTGRRYRFLFCYFIAEEEETN